MKQTILKIVLGSHKLEKLPARSRIFIGCGPRPLLDLSFRRLRREVMCLFNLLLGNIVTCHRASVYRRRRRQGLVTGLSVSASLVCEKYRKHNKTLFLLSVISKRCYDDVGV